MKEDILIICGATATGKSELGIYGAKKYNGEIVSADSMQIYKKMDIGTAKIMPNEMQNIPHHLIDIVEPNQNYSVAEYKESAEKVISDIVSRNKKPIVVGGTGLYINSLLYEYSFGNKQNPEVRQKYKDLANEFGKEYVYDILKDKNPEIAQKLHVNDIVRVIRALELIESGVEMNDNVQTPIRNYKAIAILEDREVLYDRINRRVDKMFDLGLLEEVQSLLSQGVSFDNQSMKAIGYKEFKDYFDGLITIDEVKEKIKQNSRNYAKRQFTWFRKLPNIVWCDSHENAKKIIEEYYGN